MSSVSIVAILAVFAIAASFRISSATRGAEVLKSGAVLRSTHISASVDSISLTQDQIDAVTAPIDHSCIRVKAGPGSGKTRVLVHRIGHLIQAENILPKNILALTFTRKAADEMKERLQLYYGHCNNAGSEGNGREVAVHEEGVEYIEEIPRSFDRSYRGGKVTVCTLHSFCLRLLRQFYEGFTVYVPYIDGLQRTVSLYHHY